MKALTMPLAAVMVLVMALMTGCAANSVRNLVAKGDAGRGGGPGRTVVLAKVDLLPPYVGNMEKQSRILELTGQAVDSLPGAQRVPAEALLSRLDKRDPFGLSDSELAAAALDAGVDTVVLVQVLGYGGDFAIALVPVYWTVTLDYAYHARMIDARTGALYLDAHRGRRSSQPYSVKGREELAARFKADLAALLAGVGASGEPGPGNGS